MKPSIYLLLLLFPFTAFTAEVYKMDEEEMRIMMVQMQKLQDCMQKIDQNQITAAEQHAKRVTVEIKALCAEGKRDQAQARAIAFSKKLVKTPALIELKQCSEISTGMAPMIPLLDQYKPDNFTQYDVCQ